MNTSRSVGSCNGSTLGTRIRRFGRFGLMNAGLNCTAVLGSGSVHGRFTVPEGMSTPMQNAANIHGYAQIQNSWLRTHSKMFAWKVS
jgi:hypothetical protein